MIATQVSFAGTIDERQFSRVQRALLPTWARWYVFAPACLLAFVSLGVSWDDAIANPGSAIPDLIWGAVVFGACALIVRLGWRRAWKNYILLHGAISGKVSSQGIEWKTEASSTSLSWGKLLGYRTFNDLVLVFYAPRCAFFLPKSFFANTQVWDELGQILSASGKAL